MAERARARPLGSRGTDRQRRFGLQPCRVGDRGFDLRMSPSGRFNSSSSGYGRSGDAPRRNVEIRSNYANVFHSRYDPYALDTVTMSQ